MLFSDYLRINNITLTRAADEIGVFVSTCMRWRDGSRIPRFDVSEKITEWSGGAVTYADFCEAHRNYLRGAK